MIVSILLILSSASTLACKMTSIAGDSRAINAILKQVQSETKLRDRNIKQIRRITTPDAASWAYVVETTKEGSACQAWGYQVMFLPTCDMKLQKIKARFICHT